MLLHPWDFPGKNTGVGCHFLLQEIFWTQGSNLGLLHCRQILYSLNYQGSQDMLKWEWLCVCVCVSRRSEVSLLDGGSRLGTPNNHSSLSKGSRRNERVEVSGTNLLHLRPLSYPSASSICQSQNPVPLANHSLRVSADRTWPSSTQDLLRPSWEREMGFSHPFCPVRVSTSQWALSPVCTFLLRLRQLPNYYVFVLSG